MYSFGFPKMLNSISSVMFEDKKAVQSNIKLILQSERKTLFGDPYYGCRLKRAIFEQPNSFLIDLMIDEIYSTIVTFIPQVFLQRKDVSIVQQGQDLYARVTYVYRPDNTSNLYEINLTQMSESL